MYNVQHDIGQALPLLETPPARVHHSAVYFEAKDMMIIFGGQADTGYGYQASSNDLWILDIPHTQWYQPTIAGTPPSPRRQHSCMSKQ